MAKAISTLAVELVANTAKLVTDFNTAKGHVKSLAADFKDLKHTAEEVLGFEVVKYGIEKIKELTDAVGELATEGHKAQAIEDTFAALGGSNSVIEGASNAIHGLVDNTDLMQEANRGLLAQAPGFQAHFSQIAELGARMAEQWGVNAKGGIDKVTSAILSGNVVELRAAGIIVNTNKALGDHANMYDKATKKLLIMKEALANGLNPALARAPKLADDAANAHTALGVAISEAREATGKAVNSNIDLRDAYKAIAVEIKTINWKQVGDDLSAIAAIFLQNVGPSIKYAVTFLDQFKLGLQLLDGRSIAAQLQTAMDSVDQIKAAYSSKAKQLTSLDDLGLSVPQSQIDMLKTLADQYAVAQAKVKALSSEYQKLGKSGDDGTPPLIKFGKAINDSGLSAEESQTKIKALNDEMRKAIADLQGNSLQKQIDDALKHGNTSLADDLLEKYKPAVAEMAQEYVAKFSEADPALVAQLKQDYEQKFINVEKEKIQHANEEAFKNSVSTFEDLLNGMTGNWSQYLQDELKKVAIAFAAELLAAELKVQIVGGASGIGHQLANSFLGIDNLGNEGVSTIGGASGAGGSSGMYGEAIGPTANGGNLSNASPGGMGYGAMAMGAIGGSALAYQAIADHRSQAKATTVTEMAAAGAMLGSVVPGIGTAIGAAVGAAIGTGMILYDSTKNGNPGAGAAMGELLAGPVGAYFGYQYAMNRHKSPLTKADTNFQSAVNSAIGNTDQNPNFGEVNANIFNAGKNGASGPGFSAFNSSTGAAQSSFKALADYVKSEAGITQQAGDQMAAILASDFGGSIDKAKVMVMQLGVTQENMLKQVESAGMKAGKTWLDIEGDIIGVNKLYEPGIEGIGNMKGALEELRDSANIGTAALKALKDVAVEAGEAGVKNMDQFKIKLAQAYNPQQVGVFMDALHAYHINSLDDLKNASQDTEAAILAYLQAHGFNFAQANAAIDKINSSTQVDTVSMNAASVVINTGAAPTPHASGGIISSPTLMLGSFGGVGLAGEAGSEAILPLTSVGGTLGVRSVGGGSSGGVNIYVHAPGASAGAADDIKRTLESMSGFIVQQSVAATMDAFKRGGASY